MAENTVIAVPSSYTINEVSANEDASYPAANLRDPRVFVPFRTTSMGIKAIGTLTLTANAANTETVTINVKVYTFQTVLTDVDGNVLIGATASDSLDNLIAAINLGAGSGTLYAASMTLNPDVTALAAVGDTMDVTSKLEGSAENVASTETLANGSWGAVTLTGGSESYVVLDFGVADPKISLIAAPFSKHTNTLKWRIRTSGTVGNLQGTNPSGGFTDDSTTIDAVPNALVSAVVKKLARFRYLMPLLWKTHTNGFEINVRYARIDWTDASASLLNVGRLVCSEAFQFTRNPSYGGAPVHWKEQTSRAQTAKGQRIGTRTGRWRLTRWTYESKETEWLEDLEAFMEERGTDEDLIYSWDPTHLHAHHYTFLGLLEDFSGTLPHNEGYLTTFALREVADPLK